MIEKKYTNKEGEEKSSYKLELGDTFVVKRIGQGEGNYGVYHYCITMDDKYVNLTGGQASAFIGKDIAEGTTCTVYEYTNKFGKFLGVNTGDSPSPSSSTQKPPLPEAVVTKAKEMLAKGERTADDVLTFQGFKYNYKDL